MGDNLPRIVTEQIVMKFDERISERDNVECHVECHWKKKGRKNRQLDERIRKNSPKPKLN